MRKPFEFVVRGKTIRFTEMDEKLRGKGSLGTFNGVLIESLEYPAIYGGNNICIPGDNRSQDGRIVTFATLETRNKIVDALKECQAYHCKEKEMKEKKDKRVTEKKRGAKPKLRAEVERATKNMIEALMDIKGDIDRAIERLDTLQDEGHKYPLDVYMSIKGDVLAGIVDGLPYMYHTCPYCLKYYDSYTECEGCCYKEKHGYCETDGNDSDWAQVAVAVKKLKAAIKKAYPG